MRAILTFIGLLAFLVTSALAQKEKISFPAPCRYQGVVGVSTQSEVSSSGVLLETSPQGPLYTTYAFAGRVGQTTARSLIGQLNHFGLPMLVNYFEDQTSTPSGNISFLDDIERRSNTLVAVGTSAFSAHTFGGYDLFAMLTTSGGDVITSAVYGASTEFEYGSCVIPTADGGYILAGSSRENTAQSYQQSTQMIAVVKVDASLGLQWHRRYRIQLKAFVEDLIQLTDGSYVLVGATESGIASSSRDLLVLRLSGSGTPLWARKMGNPTSGYDHGYAVRASSATGLVVVGAGSALGSGFGGEDLYVIRMDVNGNVGSQFLSGWSDEDRGIAFEVASNGVLRIGGHTRGPNANPGITRKFWQLEVGPNGPIYWSRLYASPVADALNYDLDMLPQGSAWLTGFQGTGPGTPYFKIFTIRTDSIGLINSVNGGCQSYQMPTLAWVSNPVTPVTAVVTSLSGVKRPTMVAHRYDVVATRDCVDCTQCPLERATSRIGMPELAGVYDEFRTQCLGQGSGPKLVEDYYLLSGSILEAMSRDDELTLALGELAAECLGFIEPLRNGEKEVTVSKTVLGWGYELARRLSAQLPPEDAKTVEGWVRAVERDPVAFAAELGISVKLAP
jgi:hypothetical protein